MRPRELLELAADTIDARGRQRDTPAGERTMGRAVAAFNVLTGRDLVEAEGWLFMQVLKIARPCAGVPTLDDFVDRAAYAALEAECVFEGGADGNP